MEYRMRYRDVPWPVALAVLPGKVIGTFILRPVFYIKRRWKKILSNIVSVMAVLGFSTAIYLFIDWMTDRALTEVVMRFINWLLVT